MFTGLEQFFCLGLRTLGFRVFIVLGLRVLGFRFFGFGFVAWEILKNTGRAQVFEHVEDTALTFHSIPK